MACDRRSPAARWERTSGAAGVARKISEVTCQAPSSQFIHRPPTSFPQLKRLPSSPVWPVAAPQSVAIVASLSGPAPSRRDLPGKASASSNMRTLLGSICKPEHALQCCAPFHVVADRHSRPSPSRTTEWNCQRTRENFAAQTSDSPAANGPNTSCHCVRVMVSGAAGRREFPTGSASS